MERREILKGAGVGLAGVLCPISSGTASASPTRPDWAELRSSLGERLINVRSPLAICAQDHGRGAEALMERCRNPYFLGDEPGLTQTFGWTDAWTTQPSDFALAAESPADVATALAFARKQGVRVIIKGGGHSYLGNSNAAGSLLIWTRRMQAVELHDDFVGAGCRPNASPVPAASIGAGAIWGRVYDEVAVKAGRYVQGGGCLTVGVAGFIQGGGFGSFSKQFGTGAANLLEAEVVTADGRIRVVNACQEPELFFALRGGGGGTFGIVTRVTVRTHPLPSTLGALLFSVKATSDTAWRTLVEKMIAFYAASLFNPFWGEQIRFSPGRKLSLTMLFHSLTDQQARSTWQPFIAWLKEHRQDYVIESDPVFFALPRGSMWDPAALKRLPGLVMTDDRPGASPDNVYWATNREEAGQVLHAYQSAWMPAALLRPDWRGGLVNALIAGASQWSVTLHVNKGLAGGSKEALALTRETATNPQVLDAFALLICAAEGPPAWPGIPGHEPDLKNGRREAAAVGRAMAPIRKLVPDAGAYMSEADYFDVDWERRYWGANYPRLLAIKRRYDRTNTLRGRHTVGSAGDAERLTERIGLPSRFDGRKF